MPGEEDGILGGARGARVPGPARDTGVIITEAGPIGLQTKPAPQPLSRPANVSRWDLRRLGKAEIGFCCDRYTEKYSKNVAAIRNLMGDQRASACVLIGYEVSFPPRTAGSDVFQAVGRLTISGPFLPTEVKDKTAQRQAKPAHQQPPPQDDPDMWGKAQKRLLQHEEGHINQAWTDLLDILMGQYSDFVQKFDNNDTLTYEEFKDVVRKSESTMHQAFPASAKAQDDRDLGSLTDDIRKLWIYMPIKAPGEKLD